MGKLLGNYVKHARKMKKLTVKTLAELTSISRSYIVYIENGDREPSEKALRSLTDILEIPFEDAINLQDEDRKTKLKSYMEPISEMKIRSMSIPFEEDSEEYIVKSFMKASKSNNLEKCRQSENNSKNKYTNILLNYLNDLNCSEIIVDEAHSSADNSHAIVDEAHSIIGTLGNKKWIIDCKIIHDSNSNHCENILNIFGKLTFYLNDTKNRYSIFTNNKTLFHELINNTPAGLTEMLNLSYIFVDENNRLSIVEMKDYSK